MYIYVKADSFKFGAYESARASPCKTILSNGASGPSDGNLVGNAREN